MWLVISLWYNRIVPRWGHQMFVQRCSVKRPLRRAWSRGHNGRSRSRSQRTYKNLTKFTSILQGSARLNRRLLCSVWSWCEILEVLGWFSSSTCGMVVRLIPYRPVLLVVRFMGATLKVGWVTRGLLVVRFTKATAGFTFTQEPLEVGSLMKVLLVVRLHWSHAK